jgi:hypothetical protein
MQQPFSGDAYRPISWRRRLLIAVLALTTAGSVLLYMLGRRGAILGAGPPASALPADVAACKPGQTEGCVGGMALLIVVPGPAAAASAR